jgi:hypothetical protein
LSAVAAVAVATLPAVQAVASAGDQPPNSANLTYSARTEAAAHLQYDGYASVLSADRAPMAGVWRTIGRVEHEDHWGHTMDLLKTFNNDPAHDVQVAITAYRQTVNDERASLSRAPKGADVSALRAVADRHKRNLGLLQQALSALRGSGKIPAAPTVHTVTINESSKPKFTGAFYTKDLTGSAGSALADTAWNAMTNDRVARTAVDNGQATLGRLLSGLQAQEEKQNWPSLSNMAGYVGSESANLRNSVAGEQEAINMYGQFATTAAGDPATASAFKEYRADEQGHLKVFSYELQHVKH